LEWLSKGVADEYFLLETQQWQHTVKCIYISAGILQIIYTSMEVLQTRLQFYAGFQ